LIHIIDAEQEHNVPMAARGSFCKQGTLGRAEGAAVSFVGGWLSRADMGGSGPYRANAYLSSSSFMTATLGASSRAATASSAETAHHHVKGSKAC